MKRLLPLALLALAGCDAFSDGEPATRIDLDQIGDAAPAPSPSATPAAAVADSVCETVEFEQHRFTHCVADPASHTITTALAPEGRAPYRSFASYQAENGADGIAFAMNGGMFGDDGRPVGYYVEDGERLKELNRADGPGNFHLKPNGVFFGTGSRWQVLSADRFYSEVSDRPAFGTQSGPMLVVDGAIHPEITDNGPSRLTRNAVGVDGDGRAHFVITEDAVSFGVLARYFLDELQTPNALFLDGSVSSLWDPAEGRMDGVAPLGPLIVVHTKATEAE
jgi:uncharacterized protein YigE (DUF2233 family)